MLIRALVAASLIIAAGTYSRGASAPEQVPERLPLEAVPDTIAAWQGHDSPALADDVVDALGVDEYINRRYLGENGTAIFVYVGYYASQRQGDTIHSPENCLPGAGWRPVMSDRVDISAGDRLIPVNRFVIQKGSARQAVFYWYQGRGRVVANEFANKGWLMLDAARLRRTDGGLVRLITPVERSTDAAFASLASFAAAIFPHLATHLS